MIRAAAFSALVLLAVTPSSGAAALFPTPGAADPRIQTVEFDPDQVVQVRGRLGYELTIEFGPDERIENVAIGDASAWQVTPNRRANLLFVKPLMAGASTNMTVVSDRRRYTFDLTVEGGDIPYLLKFHYAAPAVESAAAAAAPIRNREYAFKGARALKPAEVSDDGQVTYFRWPPDAGAPAIFVITPDGEENLVNSAVRDGHTVVEQVAPAFVLRNGTEAAKVVNKGWAAASPQSRAAR